MESNVFGYLQGKRANLTDLKMRMEHLKSLIIHYPNYSNLIEELDLLFHLSNQSISPGGLYIYGETGVGKSTLTQEFRDKYPRENVVLEDREYTRIPILHVKVPPKATNRMLASKILEVMGDPLHHKGTEGELTSRLYYFVEQLEIKMIILDEFQHLIDADTDHVLTSASNWVKSFTEELNIAVVLCGMPESIKVFISNPQLDRRYCNKIELKPFAFNNVEETIIFRTFLKKIEMQLPFPTPSNISDPYIASKIFYISKGIPFYVMKLIEEAVLFALLGGSDCIDETYLEKACNKIIQAGRPFVINPFNELDFDLESVTNTERLTEDRYKVNLINKKRKTRRR